MISKEQETLQKIKAGPYYSIRFQPARPMDLTVARSLELIQENAVRLRGWDFPHYDHNTIVRAQQYAGIQVDWGNHVELWRMYRSGQFVYFGAPWDLAMDFQPRLRAEFERNVILAHPTQKAEIAGVFSFVGMIYTVTEFYLFAARLAKSIETPRIIFDVGFKNIEDWALVAGETAVPWHAFYVCRIPKIELTENEYDRLVGDPLAEAANALKEIFSCFGWDNSDAAIKSWQERLMAGRYAF